MGPYKRLDGGYSCVAVSCPRIVATAFYNMCRIGETPPGGLTCVLSHMVAQDEGDADCHSERGVFSLAFHIFCIGLCGCGRASQNCETEPNKSPSDSIDFVLGDPFFDGSLPTQGGVQYGRTHTNVAATIFRARCYQYT
eukprot:6562190-Pyramimonas_sp.AAC.2